jgi:hypothetical protein
MRTMAAAWVVVVVVLAGSAIAEEPAATVAATRSGTAGTFRGEYRDSRFFDNGKRGLLVTSEALYESDGNPVKWRSVCALVDTGAMNIVGGGGSAVYLSAYDSQTSKDQSLGLYVYSNGGGLEARGRTVGRGVDFVSNETGARAAGSSVEFTEDRGKNWTQARIPKSEKFGSGDFSFVRWVTGERLVVENRRYLSLIGVSEANDPTVLWSVRLDVQMAPVVAGKDGIWVTGSPLILLDLETGEKKLSVKTGLGRPDKVAWRENNLWAWGMDGGAVYRVVDGKTDEKRTSKLPISTIVPLENDAVMVTVEGKFFRLKDDKFEDEPMRLDVDNVLIDRELERIHAPAPGRASLKEVQEMTQWAAKAGMAGQIEVGQRASQIKFATPRDRILWMTQDLQRYCAEHAGAATQEK